MLVKSGVPTEMVHTLRTVTQQQIEGEVGTIIWQDRDKKLPSDAALRAGLVRRGMARAVQFPWSRTAAETVRVYAHALR